MQENFETSFRLIFWCESKKSKLQCYLVTIWNIYLYSQLSNSKMQVGSGSKYGAKEGSFGSVVKLTRSNLNVHSLHLFSSYKKTREKSVRKMRG